MRQVISLEEVDGLLQKYARAGTVSNDYMLSDELAGHISKENLFVDHDENNLFLFLKKEGFLRLYYHLNNFESIPRFHEKPVVQEILYRGEKRYPEEEIAFWAKAGFRIHIGRDCYFAKSGEIQQISSSLITRQGAAVRAIKEDNYVREAQSLIQEYLDPFTGDILSLTELMSFSQNNELFGVFINSELAGVLQAELKNNIYWLGHMVVKSDYRGQKLSTLLLHYYFQKGLELNCRQFQLWVINDNKPALSLYQKYGFNYMNKSTISLLKTDG
jgi:GNAT superfamily N-acetyltransferase